MKVKFGKEIIETYEKELEMEKTMDCFPRARFGTPTSEEVYKLAKINQNTVFDVLRVEKNQKLGKDYDLILIKPSNSIIGIRRKYLVEV